MGAQVYAFADAFYIAFIIRKDLENMLRCKLPLNLYTDLKQLFEAITTG